MSWLLREGDVLAAIDPPARRWPASIHGALVRRAPVLVHTLLGAPPLDVAWCTDAVDADGDACLEVCRIGGLERHRVGRLQLGHGAVVVAERGAFERWQLQVGDRLVIREA